MKKFFQNQLQNIGFGIVLVLTVFMFLLSLPMLELKLGESVFQVPDLDLSLFGVESPVGNFSKGSGLYSDRKIEFTASFADEQKEFQDQIFSEDVDLIGRRLEVAGLSDVRLITEKKDGVYKLVFVFPDYYGTEATNLAGLIVRPGVVTIWEHDQTAQTDGLLNQIFPGYGPAISTLQIRDIASVNVETRSNLGGAVWRVVFQESVREILTSLQTEAGYLNTDSSNVKPLVIAVDDQPKFYLGLPNGVEMTAIALDYRPQIAELRAVASYLIDNIGVKTTYANTNISSVPPRFALEGKSVLAATFVISLIFIMAFAWMKFGLRAGVAVGLSLAYSLLLATIILKIGISPLSTGLVLAFIIGVLIDVVAIIHLIRSDIPHLEDNIKITRDMFALVFILCGIIYSFNLLFGVFEEVFGILALIAAGLYISTLFGFPQIIKWYLRV